MDIKFYEKQWNCAAKVLNELRYKTDCVVDGQLTVRPFYVVCIDDDPVSAFYACKVFFACKKQFGYEPEILCVGGTGMLSKYLNEKGCSEGQKLANVCTLLGARRIKVLDHGTNTGANLKEIIDYLGGSREPIIFCPTLRLSLRLERTVRFSTVQFPGTVPLNAYFYCPDEHIMDMAQLYNGKGLADGLPLLSEVAAIYNRIKLNQNKFNAPLDFTPSEETLKAAAYLEKHYPVRISRLPLSAPFQYLKMFLAVKYGREEVNADLREHVAKWQVMVREAL